MFFVHSISYFSRVSSIDTIELMQDENPYSFIMDSNQNKSSGPSMLQNPRQRKIISVLFVLIVIMIAIIAVSFFASLGKQNNSSLITLNAQQTEILRISDIGLKEAKDPNTKALISTLQTFITSDQSAVKSFLSKNGTKLTPEINAQKLDKTSDSNLETASQRNNYDDTLLDILSDLQTEYKSMLANALSESSTTNRKSILDTATNNIATYEDR